jgi:hypothetical protein
MGTTSGWSVGQVRSVPLHYDAITRIAILGMAGGWACRSNGSRSLDWQAPIRTGLDPPVRRHAVLAARPARCSNLLPMREAPDEVRLTLRWRGVDSNLRSLSGIPPSEPVARKPTSGVRTAVSLRRDRRFESVSAVSQVRT